MRGVKIILDSKLYESAARQNLMKELKELYINLGIRSYSNGSEILLSFFLRWLPYLHLP